MLAAIFALTAFLQAGGVVPFGRSCERSLRDAPTMAARAEPAPLTAADVARQIALGLASGPA